MQSFYIEQSRNSKWQDLKIKSPTTIESDQISQFQPNKEANLSPTHQLHICQRTFTCLCLLVKRINLINLLLTVGSPPTTSTLYPHNKTHHHALEATQTTCREAYVRSSSLTSQNLAPMNPILSFFLISSLFISTLSSRVEHAKLNAHITVMGFVYCDICSNNSFSRHSYFLPGAEVTIDCKFKTLSPRTREQISFSVNRTTNRYGIYKLEIPSVDGIACAEAAIASSCQASLMRSSSTSCNVPGYRTTTNQIVIKSKQANLCIYSLNALTFRPSKRDINLCGK